MTHKRRVLVVDDDESVGKFLKDLLERDGFQVAVARDGLLASKLYLQDTFDLIIADILLPSKDGLEIIREVRKEALQARIIAMSGGGQIGSSTYLVMAQMLGADRVLRKPLDPATLLAMVRELIFGSGQGGRATGAAP